MMQTRAVIIRLEGRDALVESAQGGGCGNCDSEGGCGSGKLAQLFCNEPRRFRVRNDSNAQVGAVVEVNLPDGMLLHSALLMYTLPLVLLIAGATIGMQWSYDAASSDAYAAIGGLAGLVLGFAIVKVLTARQRLSSVARPVIL
ncbi:MAG: SoxR reducing system RseC family protein [Gallionellaceae bacterium]|jgi:sigma-E factor negative regulatory protein RseC